MPRTAATIVLFRARLRGPDGAGQGAGGQLAGRPRLTARTRAFMARHERIAVVVFAGLLSLLLVIGYTATKQPVREITREGH